jgi:hypothetical protein
LSSLASIWRTGASREQQKPGDDEEAASIVSNGKFGYKKRSNSMVFVVVVKPALCLATPAATLVALESGGWQGELRKDWGLSDHMAR